MRFENFTLLVKVCYCSGSLKLKYACSVGRPGHAVIYGSHILFAHSQRQQRRKQNKSSWGSCFGVGVRRGGGGRLGLGWGLRHVLMKVAPESRYVEQELLFNKYHDQNAIIIIPR